MTKGAQKALRIVAIVYILFGLALMLLAPWLYVMRGYIGQTSGQPVSSFNWWGPGVTGLSFLAAGVVLWKVAASMNGFVQRLICILGPWAMIVVISTIFQVVQLVARSRGFLEVLRMS